MQFLSCLCNNVYFVDKEVLACGTTSHHVEMTCVSCPENLSSVAQMKVVLLPWLHASTMDTAVFSCYVARSNLNRLLSLEMIQTLNMNASKTSLTKAEVFLNSLLLTL